MKLKKILEEILSNDKKLDKMKEVIDGIANKYDEFKIGKTGDDLKTRRENYPRNPGMKTLAKGLSPKEAGILEGALIVYSRMAFPKKCKNKKIADDDMKDSDNCRVYIVFQNGKKGFDNPKKK